MGLTYTGEELIESMRNLGMVPNAASLGSDDTAILAHLSATIQSKLVPELLKIREEFFAATIRIALVVGTGRYRIPSRAIGNKLRDICYVDTAGLRQQLNMIEREDLQQYRSTSTGTPYGFYLEGNYVVLVPDIASTAAGWLEMTFYFRPSDLVLSTAARRITVIAGQLITCASVLPASWTTSNTFDIHSYKSGAEVKLWDLVASSVAPVGNENQITFTTVISGATFGTYSPEVGDYLCLAGEAAIPQIPRDFHSALARGAAFRMAEAFGDAQAVQIHGTLFQADMKAAIEVMNDRVEAKPMRIKGRRSILWST